MNPNCEYVSDEVLAGHAKAGDAAALGVLLVRARPMAARISASLQSVMLERSDGESICVEAFVRSLTRYDPSLGPLMGFWAANARGALLDHYRKISLVGRGNGKLAAAFAADMADAEQARGSPILDISSFARRHGVSERRALRVASVSAGVVYLDAITDPEKHIPDNTPSPADAAAAKSQSNALNQMLLALSVQEREVLGRYYGLNGKDAEPLAMIGRHYGVTPQRIQQVVAKALLRLKKCAHKLDRFAT